MAGPICLPHPMGGALAGVSGISIKESPRIHLIQVNECVLYLTRREPAEPTRGAFERALRLQPPIDSTRTPSCSGIVTTFAYFTRFREREREGKEKERARESQVVCASDCVRVRASACQSSY